MRYRREDELGDYTFGQGDNTFLIDSPEAVAQAVKTRFELWRGQWFLDLSEGTPYIESVLGKQRSDVYILAIRERILDTQGVNSIQDFEASYNGDNRRVTFTATIDTIHGSIIVTSEA
ncbi:hypothetical protein [Yersinia kristensenii]|uniref:hypothetical protein n=1 Tax=Yersinia kristensenii TaxID=28152 RepID=UPI0005E566E1|nr:hypothetical protein [Yersinia kristensenii]CFR19444.1 Uncharacterised protein [Yersinia kristensenii]